MKRITLSDIAKDLGVSKTLVSLVLNGKGEQHSINKDTMQKVLDYASKNNYKPNKLAQGLRTGKSKIIGLIVADITNEFYSNIAKEIEYFASQNNYQIIICCSNEEPEKEIQQIQILREHQVDGLILCPTQKNKQVIKDMIGEKFPLVLIDRYFHDIYTNVVAVDNRNGAFKLAAHILNQGFRSCGILSVSRHLIVMKDRINGITDAYDEAGISFRDDLVNEIITNEPGFNVKVEKAIIDSINNGAECFIALNNELAKAFIMAKQKNYDILKDIKLYCYDDVVINMLNNPPITAVKQPIGKICSNAIELLIGSINKGSDAKRIVLETELIIRD